MPAPFVTFCIPTYQRAGPLGELLASLAPQITDDTEVVIAEEPSGDDATARVVAEWAPRFPRLRHERNSERLTFDRNFLRVLDLAAGDYCWMLGDDDIVEPGGVARAVAALRQEPPLTGMTVNLVAYDHTLSQRIYRRPFQQQASGVFTDAAGMFLCLLDQIGFLSSTILRREAFVRARARGGLEEFVGSGYIQVAALMRMMKAEPRWGYLAEPCVGWRADNDSFNERGLLGRLKMDVEGYARVAADVFGADSEVYHAAMAQVARSHARHHIVRAKLGGASAAYTREAFALCRRTYGRYPAYWLHTFPLLLMPSGLLRQARRVYQGLRGALGK